MAKKKSEHETQLYFRGINSDLKAQFKACCAARGMTMTDVIVQFMRNSIKDDNRELRRPAAGK